MCVLLREGGGARGALGSRKVCMRFSGVSYVIQSVRATDWALQVPRRTHHEHRPRVGLPGHALLSEEVAGGGPVRFVSCAVTGPGKVHVWKTDVFTWCWWRWVHRVAEGLPELTRCQCLRAAVLGVSGGEAQVLDGMGVSRHCTEVGRGGGRGPWLASGRPGCVVAAVEGSSSPPCRFPSRSVPLPVGSPPGRFPSLSVVPFLSIPFLFFFFRTMVNWSSLGHMQVQRTTNVPTCLRARDSRAGSPAFGRM